MNHLITVLAALPLIMATLSQENTYRSGAHRVVNTKQVAVQQEGRMTKGTWGGDHISVEVTDEGARIEFACAHGISELPRIDNQGRFSAKGTYIRERGGPQRVGEEDKGEPVIYSGNTDGKTATLTITNSANGEVLGTFTITHGKVARIRKCL